MRTSINERRLWIQIALFGVFTAGVSGVSDEYQSDPVFEQYATIEAETDGVPVYSLGNITYIYGVSPELAPGIVMQEGNTHPKTKIRPKKSWEIESNWFGAYPASPQVRTARNDSTPLLPIHLIDGDPDTAWASYGCFAPDVRDEWVRIDLPRESTVSSVALVCSQNFAMGGCTGIFYDTVTYEKGKLTDWMGFHRWGGRALPRRLTVQVSRDAWHWENVYESGDLQGNEDGETVISFDPVSAKQIMVKAGDFPRILDKYVGYGWSMGELEVRAPDGDNLALISRGAGVSASSTTHLLSNDRFTQQYCFAPVLYDLGLKWVVITSDEGMQGWHNVEHVKGQLEVDPAFDAMITDLNEKGINVIMGLDVKANPVYLGRKIDWVQARYREINNDYYDSPGWVYEFDGMLEPYLRYVEFIARHFKGRVAYYTFAADVPESANLDFFATAMGLIKEIDPEVELIGGESHFFFPGSSVEQGKLRLAGRTLLARENMNLADGAVSVKARSGGGEVGLLLRFQDESNHIAATFNPHGGGLSIREVANGKQVSAVNQESSLGAEVTLRGEVSGSTATLSASDGKRTETLTHEIERIRKAGSVGLYYEPGPTSPIHVAAPGRALQPNFIARFDDFTVNDRDGRKIVSDPFDTTSERADGWRLVEGRWMADVPKSERALIPTMTTLGAPLPGARVDAGGTLDALQSYYPAGRAYRRTLRALGYEGLFNYWFMTWAAYPPGPTQPGRPDFIGLKDEIGFTDFRYWCDSEIERAKNVAQSFVGSAALDTLALYCNPYMTSSLVGQSLFRVPEPAQTITPMQPDPGYYVLRTICTALDGWRGREFEVRFDEGAQFECFTFERGPDERMIAAWIPGPTGDEMTEAKTKIVIPGMNASNCRVIDLFNGTEQELNFHATGQDTVLDGILIKDYPTLIRFKQ